MRDDFEQATEASSDAELDQALTHIEKVLKEECGIDVDVAADRGVAQLLHARRAAVTRGGKVAGT